MCCDFCALFVNHVKSRVTITIENKLDTIRGIKNGEILQTVTVDLGVGISTVSD